MHRRLLVLLLLLSVASSGSVAARAPVAAATATRPVRAEPAPAPFPRTGGYFQRLPPSASLSTRTDAYCRAHVQRVVELRPPNAGSDGYPSENASTARLQVNFIKGIDERRQRFYLSIARSAYFTGTTAEIVQYWACRYGESDEWTYARMVLESLWDQDVNGDRGQCPRSRGGVSWGVLQVKDGAPRGCPHMGFQGAAPSVIRSTSANLAFALAWSTACYRGDMEWARGLRGNALRCYGLWYSGIPRSVSGARYVSQLTAVLRARPWQKPGFRYLVASPVCRRC